MIQHECLKVVKNSSHIELNHLSSCIKLIQQCISIGFCGIIILHLAYDDYKYFHATKSTKMLYGETLKAQSQHSPQSQRPHLHVPLGDEAFVLNVTHLKELAGFLQDSVVSHVQALTRSHLVAAPLALPCSSGHRAAYSFVVGTGGRESCHGFCESVAMRFT